MNHRSRTTALTFQRLNHYYSGESVAWDRCFQPRWERGNFASRYHIVYPGFAYWILLHQEPERRATLKPLLDVMYRGLLARRCWGYWHDELGETTWPLGERNLTYAGRLATFIGFYIMTFGHSPQPTIVIGDNEVTYTTLSANLWQQMNVSPSCGVSCYRHTSMVMCNAHLLINNILHDRLHGTRFADSNAPWLKTVEEKLLNPDPEGPIFYYGTLPHSGDPNPDECLNSMDVWSLFLMSALVPEQVRQWFEKLKRRITHAGDVASLEVATREAKWELSSTELATVWTYCLARELNEQVLAAKLRASLAPQVTDGFALDPLLSGLFLLGDLLRPGGFRALVAGDQFAPAPRVAD